MFTADLFRRNTEPETIKCTSSTMKEYLMKILIVGDGNVGKSSFINRYVNGQFDKKYKVTVGVDFALKTLHWSDRERVKLHLWDIAGQELFVCMTRVFYKGALGCVVIFDITNSRSFLNCRLWKEDLDLKTMLPDGQPLPCILLANKCDLSNQAVSTESIEKFSKANGFVAWMETSAKKNRNVSEAMSVVTEEDGRKRAVKTVSRLVQEILSVQPCPDPVPPAPENLVRPEYEEEEPRGRCC